MHDESDSSGGGNVKISVNTQKQQSSQGGTTVTVNGGSSASLKHVNKPINSSIIFLGDCEMPITKSVTRKNSGSDTSANKIIEKEIHAKKIHIVGRVNGELKQQFATSNKQAR